MTPSRCRAKPKGAVSERRILLLTRNYPPMRGGMEQYSFDLYENLSRLEDVTLFANRRGKPGLLPHKIQNVAAIRRIYEKTKLQQESPKD